MRYGVIIADPPWRYGGTNQFQGGRRGNVKSGQSGSTSKHYDTMHPAEIAALPVASLAAERSVLLLWSTWPTLSVGVEVMKRWGFEQVSAIPWIKIVGNIEGSIYKPQYGVGFWVRGCSEVVLIGRRGGATIRSPYVGLLSENFGHSRKPDNLYDYAEQFPGPYLELFARRERQGWDRWGNEVASTVEVTP